MLFGAIALLALRCAECTLSAASSQALVDSASGQIFETEADQLHQASRRGIKASDEADEDDTGDVADADPGDTDIEVLTKKPVKADTGNSLEGAAAAAKPAADAPKEEEKDEKKEKKKNTKKRQAKAPVINKVVAFAPEANVTFGDDLPDDGEAPHV